MRAAANALTDITFMARPGETIGIIGGTGAGKSTLVHLLPRFYAATQGRVLLKGRDVRGVPFEELREKVGIVPQKAVLFEGTIRSNLLWGNENATDEELMEAVRLAQAEDVVASKGGLDAPIEQEGKKPARAGSGSASPSRVPSSKSRRSSSSTTPPRRSTMRRTPVCALRCAPSTAPSFSSLSARRPCCTPISSWCSTAARSPAWAGTRELLKTCEIYKEIYHTQFREKEAQA